MNSNTYSHRKIEFSLLRYRNKKNEKEEKRQVELTMVPFDSQTHLSACLFNRHMFNCNKLCSKFILDDAFVDYFALKIISTL